MSEDTGVSYSADETYEQAPQYAQQAGGDSGLVGFLINQGIAKNRQQANYVMIGIIVVMLGATLWVNWGRIFPSSAAPAAPIPAAQTTATP